MSDQESELLHVLSSAKKEEVTSVDHEDKNELPAVERTLTFFPNPNFVSEEDAKKVAESLTTLDDFILVFSQVNLVALTNKAFLMRHFASKYFDFLEKEFNFILNYRDEAIGTEDPRFINLLMSKWHRLDMRIASIKDKYGWKLYDNFRDIVTEVREIK